MVRQAQLFKDHWKEQRLFISRIVGSAVIVVLLTGALAARLVQLQVVDYQRFSDLSKDNELKIEPLAPTRGLIFDRNGLILAENIPTWQLVAVPEQVVDQGGVDLVDLADEAEVDIGRHEGLGGEGRAVGAGQADGRNAVRAQRRDQRAVDEAAEHHQHDLGRLGIGDAQTIVVTLAEAECPGGGADLVAATVHDDHFVAVVKRRRDRCA